MHFNIHILAFTAHINFSIYQVADKIQT